MKTIKIGFWTADAMAGTLRAQNPERPKVRKEMGAIMRAFADEKSFTIEIDDTDTAEA